VPRNLFFKALKIALFFFLGLFCVSMILLALLYIHHLVQHSTPSVKLVVWSLTGLGLFILAAAGLYLKGRSDASTDMMGRVQELKDHIVELQRFNLEMEKRLRRMDEEIPRQGLRPAETPPVPMSAREAAPLTVNRTGAPCGKKFRWPQPWKSGKSGAR